MTGFEVAKDLMKIDFSPPSEAPEEFRALTFAAPPMKKGQGKPALLASQIYHQGTCPSLHEQFASGFMQTFCLSRMWQAYT